MNSIKNSIVLRKDKKPIITDAFYLENGMAKPVVIFCHGYKGFKDWGAWDTMAKAFANAGFFFIKFNFSHNGGTIEQPIDFPNLEDFGNNNYTKELDDLECIIDWVCNTKKFNTEIDVTNINVIGHSRAGGIVTIKAEENKRIKKVITLAGVSNFGERGPIIGDLKQWKEDGVKYVLNGRTKQQMPHYYQFYENYIANKERLSIKRAVSNLKIPYLIIHGNQDASVLIDEAKALYKWKPDSKLEIIEGANHVFGASHPWNNEYLPEHLKDSISKMVSFLKA